MITNSTVNQVHDPNTRGNVDDRNNFSGRGRPQYQIPRVDPNQDWRFPNDDRPTNHRTNQNAPPVNSDRLNDSGYHEDTPHRGRPDYRNLPNRRRDSDHDDPSYRRRDFAYDTPRRNLPDLRRFRLEPDLPENYQRTRRTEPYYAESEYDDPPRRSRIELRSLRLESELPYDHTREPRLNPHRSRLRTNNLK